MATGRAMRTDRYRFIEWAVEGDALYLLQRRPVTALASRGPITVLTVHSSRMLAQSPFPLYVTAQFGARHWLVGLCHGLLALGFVVAAPAWARRFEGRPGRRPVSPDERHVERGVGIVARRPEVADI